MKEIKGIRAFGFISFIPFICGQFSSLLGKDLRIEQKVLLSAVEKSKNVKPQMKEIKRMKSFNFLSLSSLASVVNSRFLGKGFDDGTG